MTKHSIGITLVCLLGIMSLANAAQADRLISTSASENLVSAINRDICFSHFWYGTPYLLGHKVDVTIKADSNSNTVWGNRFLAPEGKFRTVFKIKNAFGAPFVESSRSYNKDYVRDDYGAVKSTSMATFVTWQNCSPSGSVDTSRLRKVERAIGLQLASRTTKDKVQPRKFLVGPVDGLNPVTFIYFMSTGELFTFRSDPEFGEKGAMSGKYMFGQAYDRDYIRSVSSKLKKFGTVVSLP